MPRMPVRRLETRPAFAEVDLARDAGIDHPLERAVDGGAADARILPVHEADEIVRAQVAFLLQERTKNVFAFGGALAAGGPKVGDVRERTFHGEFGDR